MPTCITLEMRTTVGLMRDPVQVPVPVPELALTTKMTKRTQGVLVLVCSRG